MFKASHLFRGLPAMLVPLGVLPAELKQFLVPIRPMVKTATAAGGATVNVMMEDPT
jgi:hypothetical protein